MLFAKDFRLKAREALIGKWGIAIAAAIIVGILNGGISLGVPTPNFNFHFDRNINFDGDWQNISSTDWQNFSFPEWLIPLFIGAFGIIMIMSIISIAIGGAVNVGYSRFNLNLIDKVDAKIENLFSGFSIFLSAFVTNLLITIYTILWSILFIIPGIIAAFSYSQAFYILAEDKNISASQAITMSKNMMQGNKWRLFCLNISFIGWSFLCIFTCGIGFLWLSPYISAAKAAFYREVSNSWKNSEQAAYSGAVI